MSILDDLKSSAEQSRNRLSEAANKKAQRGEDLNFSIFNLINKNFERNRDYQENLNNISDYWKNRKAAEELLSDNNPDNPNQFYNDTDTGILFKPDSAEFLKDESELLNKYADILKGNNQIQASISGFYNDVPSSVDGEELADQRAKAVKQALLDRGVSEDSFWEQNGGAVGVGPGKNDTTTNGELNRLAKTLFTIKDEEEPRITEDIITVLDPNQEKNINTMQQHSLLSDFINLFKGNGFISGEPDTRTETQKDWDRFISKKNREKNDN